MTEVENRRCEHCDTWKPLDDFSPRGRGLYRVCDRCQAEAKAAAILGNPPPPKASEVTGVVTLADGLKVDTSVVRSKLKFTAEIRDKILVEAGKASSLYSVAARVGVPYTTLRVWRQDYDREPFRSMNLEYDKVLAGDREALIDNMRRIAYGEDAAAARATEFLLKKKFPQEFGDKVVHDITHRRGVDEEALARLTDEELLMADAIRRKLESGDDDATD